MSELNENLLKKGTSVTANSVNTVKAPRFNSISEIIRDAYLIHSQRQPERYWAKRSKPGFTEHNDFFVFMELGRIYVFE